MLGRDFEIRQVVDILMRRRQNNPILTGEAGVGKTRLVEEASGAAPATVPEMTASAAGWGDVLSLPLPSHGEAAPSRNRRVAAPLRRALLSRLRKGS